MGETYVCTYVQQSTDTRETNKSTKYAYTSPLTLYLHRRGVITIQPTWQDLILYSVLNTAAPSVNAAGQPKAVHRCKLSKRHHLLPYEYVQARLSCAVPTVGRELQQMHPVPCTAVGVHETRWPTAYSSSEIVLFHLYCRSSLRREVGPCWCAGVLVCLCKRGEINMGRHDDEQVRQRQRF